MREKLKNISGVTLIELLIGIVITTIIMGAMYTTYNGKILKVFKTFVEYGRNYRPGVVFEIKNDSILVGTGNGLLGLLEIQIEGKRKMFISDFIRGNPIGKNSVFGK